MNCQSHSKNLRNRDFPGLPRHRFAQRLRPVRSEPRRELLLAREDELLVGLHHIEVDRVAVGGHRELDLSVEDEAPEWCGTRRRPWLEAPTRAPAEEIDQLAPGRAQATAHAPLHILFSYRPAVSSDQERRKSCPANARGSFPFSGWRLAASSWPARRSTRSVGPGRRRPRGRLQIESPSVSHSPPPKGGIQGGAGTTQSRFVGAESRADAPRRSALRLCGRQRRGDARWVWHPPAPAARGRRSRAPGDRG